MELRDNRPISLVGSVHKLSKVLANKLKSILPYNISPFQGPFANKRQFLDGIWLLMSFVIQGKVSQRGRHFLRLICKRLATILSGLLLIICYIDLGFGTK